MLEELDLNRRGREMGGVIHGQVNGVCKHFVCREGGMEGVLLKGRGEKGCKIRIHKRLRFKENLNRLKKLDVPAWVVSATGSSPAEPLPRPSLPSFIQEHLWRQGLVVLSSLVQALLPSSGRRAGGAGSLSSCLSDLVLCTAWYCATRAPSRGY